MELECMRKEIYSSVVVHVILAGPHRKNMPKRPSEPITLGIASNVVKANPLDSFSINPTDNLEIISVPVKKIGEIRSIEAPPNP